MNRFCLATGLLVVSCLLSQPFASIAQIRKASRSASAVSDPGIGTAEAGEVAGVALPQRHLASIPLVEMPSQPAPAQPSAGLVINGTFDSSITSDPNAVAIEGAFNRAVAIYQSLYRDPITVNILFRYSTTLPNGSAIPSGSLARSNWIFYTSPG